jgi:hypothetical protein
MPEDSLDAHTSNPFKDGPGSPFRYAAACGPVVNQSAGRDDSFTSPKTVRRAAGVREGVLLEGDLPAHASPGIGPDFDHRLTLDTLFVFGEQETGLICRYAQLETSQN